MQNTQTCPLCGYPSIPLERSGLKSYAHCPQCKGISMDRDSLLEPKLEGERYRRHNNDINDPRYQNFVRPLVDLIASKQESSHEGLDFGAGPGPVISSMLGKRGFTMRLYDPFFHPDVSVLQTKYSFIVACEVIEHFHNPQASFKQLSSLLASNGTLYCRTTLTSKDIEFDRWFYKNDDTHVFFYHKDTIAWIAENILACSHTIIDRNLLYFSR